MIFLQIPQPAQDASNTILDTWGAPGAIIIVLIIGIVFAARWITKREDKRRDYDIIEKEKFRKRHDDLQNKYETQIIIQTQNSEKVIGLAEDLKDVVANNTIVMKEFGTFLNK